MRYIEMKRIIVRARELILWRKLTGAFRFKQRRTRIESQEAYFRVNDAAWWRESRGRRAPRLPRAHVRVFSGVAQ